MTGRHLQADELSTAALLVIDMQQAFDGPGWPPRWNGRLDGNGLAVLRAWRAAALPLIHVRHDSVVAGSTLWPGSPGHAFRPGFEPAASEAVVGKTVNAAFIGTDLDLRLRRFRTRTVVAFGLSTDQCVSTTVRVGANLGYRMVLVEDACDCFDLPGDDGTPIPARRIQEAHVATLRAEFATVIRTDALLACLDARSAGPDPGVRS